MILYGGQGQINSLLLMNEGYQVSKGYHQNIPYFGYREGGHFLEKAIERFNHDNELGINVKLDY